MWEPDHPALKRFKAKRCASMEDVRAWVAEEQKHKDRKEHTDEHGRTGTGTERRVKTQASVSVSAGPCRSVSDSTLVANAALSLLNLCCYLLDRQLAAQARLLKPREVLQRGCIGYGTLKGKAGRAECCL
jgi:hypothetical protein